MKSYVIDANVIFSSIISQKELYLQLAQKNIFYTPDYIFLEIEKYRKVILKKSKTSHEDLKNFTFELFKSLIPAPDYVISEKSYNRAKELCKDIDLKDMPYLALSIEMNATLLTRDKPLYDGLKAKGFEQIKMFDEFLRDELST